MKKLLLHAGGNKTGTTSFQTTCLASYEELLENNIIYPDLTNIFPLQPPRSHWPLAVFFKNRPENYYIFKDYAIGSDEVEKLNKRLISEFGSELTKADTCLVSSEAFGVLSIQELKRAKKYFSQNFDCIEVVFYARQPGRFFVSLFQELVKGGHTPDMNQVLKSKNFDQPQQATNLKQVFGECAIFRIHDKNLLSKNCIVSDVFNHPILGEDKSPTTIVSINQSFTAPAVALQYILNRHISRWSEHFPMSRSIGAEVNFKLQKLPGLRLPSQRWEAYVNYQFHEKWLNYLSMVDNRQLHNSFEKRLQIRKDICSNMSAPDHEAIEQWLMPNLKHLSKILMPGKLLQLIEQGVIGSRDADMLRKSFMSN